MLSNPEWLEMVQALVGSLVKNQVLEQGSVVKKDEPSWAVVVL